MADTISVSGAGCWGAWLMGVAHFLVGRSGLHYIDTTILCLPHGIQAASALCGACQIMGRPRVEGCTEGCNRDCNKDCKHVGERH